MAVVANLQHACGSTLFISLKALKGPPSLVGGDLFKGHWFFLKLTVLLEALVV